MEPSGWLGPIFWWNKYEAKRSGKPVLIYIGTSCSRGIREICFGTAARWGFRLLSLLSLFSAAWFSLVSRLRPGEKYMYREKRKKRRETTINPTFAVASGSNFLHSRG
jgi:hypothetical protein